MTNRYDLIKIQEKLQKKLTPDRYQHTLGVMYTCAALAMCHGCNLERAMVAGLLHDCAKCIPNDKKISICEKNNIAITEAERKNPSLLHAKPVYFLQNPNMTLKMRIFWMRFDIIQPEMSI